MSIVGAIVDWNMLGKRPHFLVAMSAGSHAFVQPIPQNPQPATIWLSWRDCWCHPLLQDEKPAAKAAAKKAESSEVGAGCTIYCVAAGCKKACMHVGMHGRLLEPELGTPVHFKFIPPVCCSAAF